MPEEYMNVEQLTQLLEKVKNQETALEELKNLPYEDLSYAKVNHHWELRNDYPEVIYSPGKTLDQIKGSVENISVIYLTLLSKISDVPKLEKLILKETSEYEDIKRLAKTPGKSLGEILRLVESCR